MPDWVLPIVLALLGTGFGMSVLSVLRGVDIFRGRTAKTEAQGISFLERSLADTDWRRLVAIHRMEYYRDAQNPYLRNRIGDLEFIIRTELGRDRVPPWEPGPVMEPLPPKPKELERAEPDERSAVAADGGT